MARTKKMLEDLVKTVINTLTRKGYKTISKEFGLHQSTVRQVTCQLVAHMASHGKRFTLLTAQLHDILQHLLL